MTKIVFPHGEVVTAIADEEWRTSIHEAWMLVAAGKLALERCGLSMRCQVNWIEPHDPPMRDIQEDELRNSQLLGKIVEEP